MKSSMETDKIDVDLRAERKKREKKSSSRILITGANGQLGRALVKELRGAMALEVVTPGAVKPEIATPGAVKPGTIFLAAGRDILDITSEEQVHQVCEQFRPDVIINAAAYTAVDAAEDDAEQAFLLNAKGPEYLAKEAEALGAKLIHVSTDYVFGGQKTTELPYVETDPVAPISVYGKSKAAGEQAVLRNCSRAFVVRTAWLYGDGKNFVRTMLRLAGVIGQQQRPVIKVVNDQHGCPTSAAELARMIVMLCDPDGSHDGADSAYRPYGIWHAVCEGDTTWYGFAKEIFRQVGADVDLRPVTSEEYPTRVKRPAWSVLADERLHNETEFRMKHWKEALAEYLRENV